MAIDSRSMATRFQLTGSLNEYDLEVYRRKLPLTPEARINGTFQMEEGRKHSPKGLLEGKYIFHGTPERNEWQNGPVFWRCAAIAAFPYNGDWILDYDIFNISTFVASESVQVFSQTRAEPVSYMPPERKLEKIREIIANRHFLEVIERIPSSKYQDYWPVKFKGIASSEFPLSSSLSTSTYIEFRLRLARNEITF